MRVFSIFNKNKTGTAVQKQEAVVLLFGKNDGKVSVERAKLDGMTDFLVVHNTHPFIMNSTTVRRPVSAFILNGVFIR
jgi:hypothetical protein